MRRGEATVWVSPDAVAGWRAPALRQAEGLVASIFALLGLALPAPGRTTSDL